ncbi:hypothetical protein [Candidatus Lokiarchaeum ossiferum]
MVQIANLIINGKASGTDLDEFATKQYHSRKLPFKKACMKVAFKLSRIVYNILVKNIQYDPHYEQTQQKMQKLLRRKARTGTLLQSAQVRALRKDIGRFFVNHHEHLNSKSRFLLTRGFTQMIDKVNKKDLNDKDTK